MARILGQGGFSIADVYDIEGSKINIEHLEDQDVSLVHDVGAQIFAERTGAQILRLSSGDILQTISWGVEQVGGVDLNNGVQRILGVCMLADDESRLIRAQVSLRDPVSGREFPIFAWENALDTSRVVRIVENGQAVNNFDYLVPIDFNAQQPSLRWGGDYASNVPNIMFRGTSSTFGAGTVECIVLIYVAGPTELSSVSSYGLPIPGW